MDLFRTRLNYLPYSMKRVLLLLFASQFLNLCKGMFRYGPKLIQENFLLNQPIGSIDTPPLLSTRIESEGSFENLKFMRD